VPTAADKYAVSSLVDGESGMSGMRGDGCGGGPETALGGGLVVMEDAFVEAVKMWRRHRLVEAVYEGELEKVKAELDLSDVESLNLKGEDGDEALMAAIEANHLELLSMLLEAKCNPNSHCNGVTPLYACCPPDFTDGFSLILKAKADPNWECVSRSELFRSDGPPRGQTPLIKVCSGQGGGAEPPLSYVQQLLEADANPNYRCLRGGETALKAACRRSNTQCIKALVAAKVDVEETNEEGLTPLMEAYLAPTGGHRTATTLQICGARVETETKEGLTALIHVSTVGTGAQVGHVLDDEAPVNQESKTGRTALIAAVTAGNAPAVKALLRSRGDVQQRNQHGTTPEALAKLTGTQPVLDRVLEALAAKEETARAKPATAVESHLLRQEEESQAAGVGEPEFGNLHTVRSSADITRELHAGGAPSAPLAFGVAP